MAEGFKTGGRQKGSLNKISRDLKEMILGALDDAGGREYLAAQAIESPAAFLSLVGKILPMQIGGDPDGIPIATTIEDMRAAARREIDEAFPERARETGENHG